MNGMRLDWIGWVAWNGMDWSGIRWYMVWFRWMDDARCSMGPCHLADFWRAGFPRNQIVEVAAVLLSRWAHICINFF